MDPIREQIEQMTRRHFFGRTGLSLGTAALSCVMGSRSFLLPAAPGPATYHLFQNVLKALMQAIRPTPSQMRRRVAEVV